MNRRTSCALGAILFIGASNAASARTVVCKDTQALTVSNKTLTRVVASDNCNLKLVNCVIRSGGVAIAASDNAEVSLVRSDVSGRRYAIRATGNATVRITRSAVYGRLVKQDNAEIKRVKARMFRKPIKGRSNVRIDGMRVGVTTEDVRVATGPTGTRVHAGGVKVMTGPGGTHVDTGGTSASTSPRGTTVTTPAGSAVVSAVKPRRGLRRLGAVVCNSTNDMVIRNRRISAAHTGVSVSGTCTVKLINCHVVGGKYAIRATGTGDVHLINTYVQGRKGSVVVTGTGSVFARHSTFYGRKRITGTGSFHDKGGNVFKPRW